MQECRKFINRTSLLGTIALHFTVNPIYRTNYGCHLHCTFDTSNGSSCDCTQNCLHLSFSNFASNHQSYSTHEFAPEHASRIFDYSYNSMYDGIQYDQLRFDYSELGILKIGLY